MRSPKGTSLRRRWRKYRMDNTVLYKIKREIHEKAVYPHNAGIDAYVSLKVVDAIINNYISKDDQKK
jgi:hypothetical protein